VVLASYASDATVCLEVVASICERGAHWDGSAPDRPSRVGAAGRAQGTASCARPPVTQAVSTACAPHLSPMQRETGDAPPYPQCGDRSRVVVYHRLRHPRPESPIPFPRPRRRGAVRRTNNEREHRDLPHRRTVGRTPEEASAQACATTSHTSTLSSDRERETAEADGRSHQTAVPSRPVSPASRGGLGPWGEQVLSSPASPAPTFFVPILAEQRDRGVISRR